MHNIHARMCFTKLLLLQLDKISTNLDDIIMGSIVHLCMFFLKVIKNILSQSPISGTDFVYDEVFVWKIFQKIF